MYLELRSISFSGRYTLCVTPPAATTDCRFFTLRRSGDRFVSPGPLGGELPGRRPLGRYEVVWRLGPDAARADARLPAPEWTVG